MYEFLKFPLEFVKEDHNTIVLRTVLIEKKYRIYYVIDLNNCVRADYNDFDKDKITGIRNMRVQLGFEHCKVQLIEEGVDTFLE